MCSISHKYTCSLFSFFISPSYPHTHIRTHNASIWNEQREGKADHFNICQTITIQMSMPFNQSNNNVFWFIRQNQCKQSNYQPNQVLPKYFDEVESRFPSGGESVIRLCVCVCFNVCSWMKWKQTFYYVRSNVHELYRNIY